LDWDDTVTEFPNGFRKLCALFDEVIIITLNHGVTQSHVQDVLGREASAIMHCPDDVVCAGKSHLWKAIVCDGCGVDVMFDDDPMVIKECRRCGIPAIGVGVES